MTGYTVCAVFIACHYSDLSRNASDHSALLKTEILVKLKPHALQ